MEKKEVREINFPFLLLRYLKAMNFSTNNPPFTLQEQGQTPVTYPLHNEILPFL